MTWMCWLFIVGSLGFDAVNAQSQSVAPGIPPQHYQQHQKQGRQRAHHQQQIPQDQYQQGQDHVHGHGHGQPQHILNAANIAEEKDHIAEHFNVPIDTAKMTEQELQFHYFKMYDVDNNNRLDGCEMIQSLIHWHGEGNKNAQHGETAGGRLFEDNELAAIIDPILETNDANSDGYIDYPEFIARQ